MRDSTSLLGLPSLPIVVAVLAVLPIVSAQRRPAPPQATPPADSASFAVTPLRVDSVASFEVDRTLIEEAGGTAVASVETFIALLPDPDESSLDWMYDAHLAAIRRALEGAGYVSDRAWHPDPDDSVVLEAGGAARRAPDMLPGVLVFRGGGGASTDSLLLVYVVGELPTEGVHRHALRTALDRIRTLLDADGPAGASDTIRIIGPTFSGSAPSLASVLSEIDGTGSCTPISIVSGSSTSASARELLNLDGLPCRVGKTDATRRIRFQATVHTDDDYGAAVSDRLLDSMGLSGLSVALLTEANTLYGQSIGEPQGEGASDAGSGQRLATKLDSALRITFPLNIASVRAEYDRNPEAVQEAERRGPTSRLPLSLQLSPRPRENSPTRSRLTAPTLDLVVQDALATLREHHIRAVGILASDVRDKLFLAQVVKRALPDVLLFTYEGHLLYARRDMSHALRGMVVASSYPLILENAVWTRTEGMVPFSTEGAAGVFNATVLTVGRPELVQQYRAPVTSRDATRRPRRPPIWLTAVGSGSMLPLAAIDPMSLTARPTAPFERYLALGVSQDSVPPQRRPSSWLTGPRPAHVERYLAPHVPWRDVGTLEMMAIGDETPYIPAATANRAEGAHAEHRPGVLDAVAVILGAALAVLALGLLLSALFPALRGDGTARLRRFCDGFDALDVCAGLVVVLAFIGPLSVLNAIEPAWSADQTDPHAAHKAGTLQLLAETLVVELVVLWGALLTLALRRLVLWWKSESRRSLFAVLTDLVPYAVVLALGALAGLYIHQIWTLSATPPEYSLYRYRTLRLYAGGSGLVPFLVATVGAMLLVLWHRERRTLLGDAQVRPWETVLSRSPVPPADAADTREPDPPTPGASESDPQERGAPSEMPQLRLLGRQIETIRARLEVRLDPRRVVIGVAAAVFVVVLLRAVFVDVSIRTLDDMALRPGLAAPTLVLWAGLALGFAGVGITVAHLFAVWPPFRSFLAMVADLPLAPALGRLPTRVRTLGRLHLFDPPSARLGEQLAEAGHEAVWAHAARLKPDGRTGLDAVTIECMGRQLARTETKKARVETLERLKDLEKEERIEPGRSWFPRDEQPALEDADAFDTWLCKAVRGRSLQLLLGALKEEWRRQPGRSWATGEAKAAREDADAFDAWLCQVEDLAAVEITRYIDWVLRSIRRIAFLLLFVILFTTAMLESIPFPHHSSMTTLFIVLVAAGVGSVVALMFHLSRDETLSRISGSEPGKVNWNSGSLISALLFVAIPVLGLLGTEVSPVGQALFGWVEGLLRLLSNA